MYRASTSIGLVLKRWTPTERSFYTCIVTVLRPTAVRLSSVYIHTWIFNINMINYGFTTLNKTHVFRDKHNTTHLFICVMLM
jgi:hypothetical protein